MSFGNQEISEITNAVDNRMIWSVSLFLLVKETEDARVLTTPIMAEKLFL